MADKSCTHCGGTGKEPDPIGEAAQKLVDAIDADAPSSSLISAARHLGRMADAVIADRDARITFLEAALRDILDRFPPTETGTATTTQPQPCTWHDVRNWRAILGDEGMTHRHWSFWDPDHIGALKCSCGTRWRPGSGPSPEPPWPLNLPPEPTCPGGC